jgi:hypothetical protein
VSVTRHYVEGFEDIEVSSRQAKTVQEGSERIAELEKRLGANERMRTELLKQLEEVRHEAAEWVERAEELKERYGKDRA